MDRINNYTGWRYLLPDTSRPTYTLGHINRPNDEQDELDQVLKGDNERINIREDLVSTSDVRMDQAGVAEWWFTNKLSPLCCLKHFSVWIIGRDLLYFAINPRGITHACNDKALVNFNYLKCRANLISRWNWASACSLFAAVEEVEPAAFSEYTTRTLNFQDLSLSFKSSVISTVFSHCRVTDSLGSTFSVTPGCLSSPIDGGKHFTASLENHSSETPGGSSSPLAGGNNLGLF